MRAIPASSNMLPERCPGASLVTNVRRRPAPDAAGRSGTGTTCAATRGKDAGMRREGGGGGKPQQMSNLLSAAQTTGPQLAATAGAAWIGGIAVVVIVVLLGGFWWGSRRTARRPMPPQAPQPRSDSWHEPDESETRHTAAPSSDDPGR